jgi:hypothetical protein
VTNSKLYLASRKCPDVMILHHFVISFRGPRPPHPSPKWLLASFKILMKPLQPWTLHFYLNFHCYQFKTWHLVMKSVIWKSLWPIENFKILAWYEMHLICKMFYFCFHGNHSHNLRLKVYLVVSFVISYVEKIISVNTI